MLSGLDPILIFQFKKFQIKSLSTALKKIPYAGQIISLDYGPPIPIYLAEQFTGLIISSEDKVLDLNSDTQTTIDASLTDVAQKGGSSTLTINIEAKKNSIILPTLAAVIDLIFDKATSKEYSISYLHGATIIFGAVLQSFSINQQSGTDLLSAKIELQRGDKKKELPTTPDGQGQGLGAGRDSMGFVQAKAGATGAVAQPLTPPLSQPLTPASPNLPVGRAVQIN